MRNLNSSSDVGAGQAASDGRPSTSEVQQSLTDARAAGATFAEIEARIRRAALGLRIKRLESSP